MSSTRLRSAVLCALVAPGVALAQQPPQGVRQLEEIIVTAQKRAESLQDIPFSVAAVTDESIRRSGSNNIVELARNVSGLTITDLGPGQSQVAIRGISAGQVVRDQPGVKESVGIYLDESPISIALFTPDLDLYDVDRVEVLRGPQGTLFGAGSSSGTLRYITKQPDLEGFTASTEVGASSVQDGEVGFNVKGALNAPLGDTVALRVVGYYSELPGFMDSIYPDRGKKEDVNSGERTGVRAALRFQPNDQFSITPRIVYQKLETDGYPRIDVWNILGNPYTTTESPVQYGERTQVTQIREGIEDEFTLGDLKLEYDFGGITLTSITSYTDRQVTVVRDASQLTGSVTYDLEEAYTDEGARPADVRLNSPLIDATDLNAFSQELRLSSNDPEAMFRWLVGAFYQQVDREYGQTLPTPGYDAQVISRLSITPGMDSTDLGAPPDHPYFSDLTYDFEQFAVFGEGTWQFTDAWSLTAGLRWYDFSEDRLLTFAGIFADQGYTDEPGTTESDGFSPRAIVAFRPNEDVMLTAQVARGFRLGGINDPLNVTLCEGDDIDIYGGHPTWDDEETTNYELGAKTRWADGRVQLNAALFYTDIDGLQVIADAGSCSSRIILNAQAESIGGELELFARPNESWDFALTATYAKAEITESQLDANGNPIAGIREGNRLPTSPELQAAASATYSWPWSTSLDGYVNFTVQHVGSSYTQLADQEPGFGELSTTPSGGQGLIRGFGAPSITEFSFDAELPDYQIGNLRLGVRSDQWEVAAYVNNLWDERAFLSIDRERGRSARVGYLTNQPRTYGIALNYGF
ncbi:MAG TPA: TonB-dependent receptor [Steroidobacteraceae bacterium]|nr:TonB-dependent receptor [Steroidobacteraceae bacterium]